MAAGDTLLWPRIVGFVRTTGEKTQMDGFQDRRGGGGALQNAVGGFAAAGRALRAPKSTLSRRIAALETRLGVRLIERSTRRFRVTETGQAFYERCRIVVMDVEQADAVVSEALGEPRGVVRCSCPLGLVELLSPTFS
jgi:DNA-binding transcriptional LysR family regulator